MEKIKKLVEFPKEIMEVLEKHKIDVGRSTSSMIQEAVWRWCVHEKLIKIKTKVIEIEKNSIKKNINIVPKDIEFCDAEGKCDIPIKGEEKA